MGQRQLLLAVVLSITCCVYAQQQHTVVAMVVGKNVQKLPEIKVNGMKMNLQAPQGNQEALVQGPPSDTATYIVGKKASDKKPPVMAAALLMPSAPKPKTAHQKMMDALKLTKEEKEKLFPCEDYQPWCKNYAATGQCRDVWTQKNCRKSCKLCEVPYGVFIGCQDLDVCKKFAASACMTRWVKETCKSKCGQCGYERQGNSHIVMGKKRHFPGGKAKHPDKTVSHKHEDKHTENKHHKTSHHDKPKQLHKVLKKITKKGKDEVKKVALKIQKIKEDVPKKASKAAVKTNDKPKVMANNKPEVAKLKPEVVMDEKPVPKDEEDESEGSGQESKAVMEKNYENDKDDDDSDYIDDDSKNNDKDQEDSGSSQDEDEDEDKDESKDKPSGHVHLSTHDHNLGTPIRIDADPRGEPVVAKLVHQPIKFNDAPGKNMKIVKQKKAVKDAHPKVNKKKVSKKAKSAAADKRDKNGR